MNVMSFDPGRIRSFDPGRDIKIPRESIIRLGPFEVTGVRRKKNPLDPDGKLKRALYRLRVMVFAHLVRDLRLREMLDWLNSRIEKK